MVYQHEHEVLELLCVHTWVPFRVHQHDPAKSSRNVVEVLEEC